MTAYYNENEPFAAAWLRNLIAAGHLPAGDVDERSIVDVRPSDLDGYGACHFFAGIGGWPHALRLAGWSDDRPVWTGSCPCQPFSAAGARKGADDERHLWPAFRWFIDQCRPPVVFGEQVASADGRLWLAGVRTDLEAMGYGVGAADLSAAGLGAPHIRQRLFWVGHANGTGRAARDVLAVGDGARSERPSEPILSGRLVDARHGALGITGELQSPTGADEGTPPDQGRHGIDGAAAHRGTAKRMADAGSDELGARRDDRADGGRAPEPAGLRAAGPWSDAILLPCTDGKARRTQPGIFPLAHGLSGRVGRLRGYGNAIVAPLAAEFIRAALNVDN